MGTNCEIQEHWTDHREGVGSVDLGSPWSKFTLCELGNRVPELKDHTNEPVCQSPSTRGITHLDLFLAQTRNFGVIS